MLLPAARGAVCAGCVAAAPRIAAIITTVRHAGHSKWANIQHQKGRADAARAAVFSKMARLVQAAVRDGGGPLPELNGRLAVAIARARGAGMLMSKIEAVIASVSQRGSNTASVEPFLLEVRDRFGALIVADVLTENKRRTLPELRQLVADAGGRIADLGSVAYQFVRKGIVEVSVEAALAAGRAGLAGAVAPDATADTETQLMEFALRAGAEDLQIRGDTAEFICDPNDLVRVLGRIEDAVRVSAAAAGRVMDDASGVATARGRTEYTPLTTMPLAADDLAQHHALLERLEAHSDVVAASGNAVLLPDKP